MALNLVGLPTELLLEIFKHLHHVDFICAAEATKDRHFRGSLRLAFLIKFRESVWQFHLFLDRIDQRSGLNFTFIHLNDFANCLKVCRYFGGQIHSLNVVVVNYGNHLECKQHHFGLLNHYISKYCRYLKTLEYNQTNNADLVLMGFGRPIPSITSLTLRDCHVNGQMNVMNFWFPKIQTLDMVYMIFFFAKKYGGSKSQRFD